MVCWPYKLRTCSLREVPDSHCRCMYKRCWGKNILKFNFEAIHCIDKIINLGYYISNKGGNAMATTSVTIRMDENLKAGGNIV